MFVSPIRNTYTRVRNSKLQMIRLSHELNKKVKKERKISLEIVNFLETTPEYRNIKDLLPKSLLIKYKSPETMYLINKTTAKDIANTIKKHIINEAPMIEVNPGFGLLTEELLQFKDKLYLYETHEHFAQHFKGLLKAHPKRISYKVSNFFNMSKLAYQDKLDKGNRIKELLDELSTNDNERIIQIVGAMPGLTFIKHLMYDLIFQSPSLMGRPNLFIALPAFHYKFLTEDVTYKKHKSTPALFQLLFDYEVLKTIPRMHYLPWTQISAKKISEADEITLYLVNLKRKLELPCQPESLPLLWYFFKPYTFTKSTKVIPMLEQWIPGCGVWIITGQDPPDTNKAIGPGDKDESLPHMTIFTEFGDLSLGQKLTLFKKFISWPGFEQCPFKATMESNYNKMAADSDDKDSIAGHVEDLEHSDVEN